MYAFKKYVNNLEYELGRAPRNIIEKKIRLDLMSGLLHTVYSEGKDIEDYIIRFSTRIGAEFTEYWITATPREEKEHEESYMR